MGIEEEQQPQNYDNFFDAEGVVKVSGLRKIHHEGDQPLEEQASREHDEIPDDHDIMRISASVVYISMQEAKTEIKGCVPELLQATHVLHGTMYLYIRSSTSLSHPSFLRRLRQE